jgi:hypothetical protein
VNCRSWFSGVSIVCCGRVDSDAGIDITGQPLSGTGAASTVALSCSTRRRRHIPHHRTAVAPDEVRPAGAACPDRQPPGPARATIDIRAADAAPAARSGPLPRAAFALRRAAPCLCTLTLARHAIACEVPVSQHPLATREARCGSTSWPRDIARFLTAVRILG